MNRRGTVAALAIAAVGAAGITPALAAPAKAKPKPLKGTWSYTDVTVDPTPSAMGAAPGTPARDGFCVGTVPSAPSDVNTHTLKVTGKGTLTVTGNNTLDWAMEIRDAKGTFLGGSDGGFPQDKEGTVLAVSKPGTYKVVFCNLGGAPTATAAYTYKYR